MVMPIVPYIQNYNIINGNLHLNKFDHIKTLLIIYCIRDLPEKRMCSSFQPVVNKRFFAEWFFEVLVPFLKRNAKFKDLTSRFSKSVSDIETEGDDIAVLNDILLAFQS